ncbi:MAG: hypothetical protein MJ002_09485 [Paludibacteraceae bacterium]|nr:hypothetical protein [Paludibacteraceae bacterium]
MSDNEDRWCIVRIPGARYKILSQILEQEFETRKREKKADQLGYIFVKHNPDTLQDALKPFDGAFPLWDCANNKRPATLTESEVILFTRLIEDTELNLIMLDHNLDYYAEGHTPVVCIDEPLVGKTGYIVRRKSNRNFVFSVGNAVTISATNAHKMRFLTVEEYEKAQKNGLL